MDASPQIGIGHLMRCLTLADALRGQGARVRFVTRHAPTHLRELLHARGHESVVLDTPPGAAGDELAHAHWLGTGQREDAIATTEALSDRRWDWIVVDHYALDIRWETEVRAVGARVLVVDDIADRRHACDVLLDQNYFHDGDGRYAGKVPAGCRLLLGPRFALLRPEYAEHRDAARARTTGLRRVLIFFGGIDPQHMAERALLAVSHPVLRHLDVDVVCGSDPDRRLALERQAVERSRTVIHGPRPHLADLMARADLALGAGGATTWERMCLGLRSLVVTLADNQLPVTRGLADQRLIRLLGAAADVTVADLTAAVADEIARDRPSEAIERGMDLSDGLGVPRVITVLCQPPGTEVR